MAPKLLSLAVRFRSKVDRRGADECWPWTGGKVNGGYGQITEAGRGSRLLRAHRVAYTLSVGPIPDGLDVLHRCDNPPCVNPRHLFAGTHQDNMRDMHAKGRAGLTRGEDSGRATLTEEQVRAIREEYARAPRGAKGQVKHGTITGLARKYGRSLRLIVSLVYGENWKHVNVANKGSK